MEGLSEFLKDLHSLASHGPFPTVKLLSHRILCANSRNALSSIRSGVATGLRHQNVHRIIPP